MLWLSFVWGIGLGGGSLRRISLWTCSRRSEFVLEVEINDGLVP